ncbi:MAG: hypothetical protein PHV68_05450 [Candidatus Gastranaerophilales bacterium]|nr:hypothetical protein [Candidatus Gastranaerophilales bacterium]
MKVSQNHQVNTCSNKKNNLIAFYSTNNLLKSSDIFFMGKQYPSGYYNDEEIADAKKYLGEENWEDLMRKQYEGLRIQ